MAKDISRVILADTHRRTRLIEPFIGAGALTIKLAPHFESVYASDIHEDLMLMWQALKAGWLPPPAITEAEYKRLASSEPSAIRGIVGFSASFAGKFFGTWARSNEGRDEDHYGSASWGLRRDIKRMQNVTFERRDYRSVQAKFGDVVYADPPYAGTFGYTEGEFNSNTFWGTAEGWAEQGAHVYVSEYSAPPEWKPIWVKRYTRNLKPDMKTAKQVEEYLFVHRRFHRV